MKIDVFNHVFPVEFFESRRDADAETGRQRWKAMEALYDMDARMRMLDDSTTISRSSRSRSRPPMRSPGPTTSPALTRVANDGMARICREHPDRMPWFIASLPMNNTEAALAEVDRVIDELGAVGFQLVHNVDDRRSTSRNSETSSKDRRARQTVWLHRRVP